MVEFQISTVINQPVSIITQALSNPKNHVYWTTNLERFEVIKGGADEVGSIAHLHYLENGHRHVMEDKLLYCDPANKYVSEVSGDALTARVETTLYSLDNKTEMVLKLSGKGKILFLKLLLPFLRGKIIKNAKKELEKFKKLVEERGADFSEETKGNS
jgi:hypothetical protein